MSGHGITMIALRCAHFAGERYNLGLLSLLLPRLKTHLVPWVAGGKARVPLVDGRDLGSAYALAAEKPAYPGRTLAYRCGWPMHLDG